MKILSPSLLSLYPEVTASFTTRHGGVSRIPYSNANLAFHVGDNAADVKHNHLLLSKKLGYDVETLVFMSQIHSDRIVVVDETMNFTTPPQCDALITNRPNTPLMVMSADCTPILLYDPRHNAIGAVHAGRAGALNKILPKTLHVMTKEYGTIPDEILVLLGPSIHGCCYEVNETIAKDVIEKGYKDALRRAEEKVFLNVNTILLAQIETVGVKQEHIEIIDTCTSCHHETYFSYRADAQHTGRIAGVIVLKSA
ncbi:MAG: peptidoglycan editing factor PgeF [Campylobacterales bacterium]|nr:peptidoglycan editing factor PgeF [Campylobacterales bacterium]